MASRPGLIASRIALSRKRSVAGWSSNRQFCPHCDKNLALKTFRKHKKLFSRRDGSWQRADDRKEAPAIPSAENDGVARSSVPTLPTFVEETEHPDMSESSEPSYLRNSSEPSYSRSSSTESDSDMEENEHEVWEDNGDVENDLISQDTAALCQPTFNNPSSNGSRAASLLCWLLIFLFSLQAKYHISDSALDVLLKFLYIFFSVLSRFSPFVSFLTNHFPKSKSLAHKYLGSESSFVRYVLCPKCFTLYSFEDSKEKCGSRESSKRCTFVPYPMHSQASRRAPCNSFLLKSIELPSGQTSLYPHKIYCYKPLVSTIQEFLLRPGFVQECDHWRSRLHSDILKDVYDGKMWKHFQNISGTPFLSAPFTYAFVLNIDWFQPYVHTVSSVGVLYLAFMNLPRYLRYKRQNIILVGIIPGPSEPSHDVNSFLKPLVSELEKLWVGVLLQVPNTVNDLEEVMVRCALLCVACDLPAGRKVCGFLSYAAAKGCSKCTKVFPGSVGNGVCYAGFDRSLWIPRSNSSHRHAVKEVMKCKTKTDKARKESEYGCRYSILLELPYFDPPKMLVIDPMHNLFLGTGKRMISVLIKNGLLDSSKFERVQQCVDSMVVPSDVGRIPRKIETGFSGFKADQFKNWIIIYSIPALYDILPREHLECWRYFVSACRLLCQNSLRPSELNLADAFLIKFCTTVESLYGKDQITPNMHLHGHLKDVLLDYGPMQEFWLFSFERYNGVLGKQPSNNRSIEPQLMNRFLRDNIVSSLTYPNDFNEDFVNVCNTVNKTQLVGSLLDGPENIIPPTKYSRCVLDDNESGILEQLHMKLTQKPSTPSSIFAKYSSITVNGKFFASSGRRLLPSVVLAIWDENLYGSTPSPLPSSSLLPSTKILRPVCVHFYMKVSFCVDNSFEYMLFASVSWFFPHPDRDAIGKPAELWCPRQFEPFGVHSFLPIRNIVCRCAHGLKQFKDEELLVIVPLVE